MYSFAVLSLALSVSALVLPRPALSPPVRWPTDILEPYDIYHIRYMALSCDKKNDTVFFDQCCHPLLSTENLATSRPAQCMPAAAATESEVEDLEYCNDENDVSVGPSTQHTATTAASITSLIVKSLGLANTASADSVYSGGYATYFYQNGNAGACGKVHHDSDLIAAIDAARYGNLDAESSLCGRKVKITNTKNGQTVTVTIADACPTCENSNSIDLSEGAFKKIAPLEDGIVPITWSYV